MENDFLDIAKVLAQKNPKLYKWVPGFVLSYLRRIVHEKELNHIVHKYQHLQGVDFLEGALHKMGVTISATGNQAWDANSRLLFVANHPLGGLDGMAFMVMVGKVLPNIVFPVNDILMHIPNLRPLFIPVNKHGRNAHLVKALDQTFASDVPILYFPAGLCSRKQGNQIVDLDWKKTVIAKARLHQRNIVPVYINGKNSSFFYNLARWRAKLGIKANIEMLFLVDEMFRQKGQTLHLHFGEPIPFATFDGRHTDNEWAALLKKHVYAVGNDTNIEFKA